MAHRDSRSTAVSGYFVDREYFVASGCTVDQSFLCPLVEVVRTPPRPGEWTREHRIAMLLSLYSHDQVVDGKRY